MFLSSGCAPLIPELGLGAAKQEQASQELNQKAAKVLALRDTDAPDLRSYSKV